MQTNSTSVKFMRLAGILDNRRSGEIQQQLNGLQLQSGDTVMLNLQDVDHMNSSGVGVLVVLLKQLQSAQIRFYLCHPSAAVMLTLRISGMLRSFSIEGHDRSARFATRSVSQSV